MARDRLLLDTHALIWWWLCDPTLPVAMRDHIENPATDVFVSAITALELAIKVRLNRLPRIKAILDRYDDALADDRMTAIPISADHAIIAGLLPGKHRDPFDRLLAAQALMEDLKLVTCDREIAAFGCKVLW